MKEKHCFKEFRRYWFNIGLIGFRVWEPLISMHSSSTLKRKRLRQYFLPRHCLPKWTDVTEWQNAKQTFLDLKKTRKITEIGYWPIRTQLSEPLWQIKINAFKMFIGCFWLKSVIFVLLDNLLLSNLTSFCVALGVWLRIYPKML